MQIHETSGWDLSLHQWQVLVSVQIVSLHFSTLYSHWHSLQFANSFCTGPFFTVYIRIEDLALLLSHGIVAIFQKVIYCSCNDCCFVLSFCLNAILWGLPYCVHNFHEGEGVKVSLCEVLNPFQKAERITVKQNFFATRQGDKTYGGRECNSFPAPPKRIVEQTIFSELPDPFLL